MMKMFSVSTLMVFVGLAVFSGCSSVPTREAMESAEANYRPDGARPQLPILTPESPFSDFLTYAILNNSDVEAAFYDWKMSVEEATVAGALPDIVLTFSTEIASTVEKFVIGLMQELPGPGKLSLRSEAASVEARKRQYLFEEEMIRVAFNVEQTYFENVLLTRKIGLTGEMIGLVDAQIASVRSGIGTGSVMAKELAMLQSERDGLTSELAGLEDSRGVLLARWRGALGVSPVEPVPPMPTSAPIKQHVDLSEDALLKMALESNVGLKALAEDIRQAEKFVELAYKDNMPDIGIGAGTDIKRSPKSFMPELSLTLPIWRERIGAQIAASRAAEGGSRSMLSAAELDLAIMVAERSFMWRETHRQAELIGKQLIPLADLKIASSIMFYRTGGIGFTEWLNDRRELLDLQVRLAEAESSLEIIYAEIYFMVLSHRPDEVGRIFDVK